MKDQEKKELFADFEAMLDSITEVEAMAGTSSQVERASGFDKEKFVALLGKKASLREAVQLCLYAISQVAGDYSGAFYALDPAAGGLHLLHASNVSPAIINSIAAYDSDSIIVRRVMGGKPTFKNFLGISILDEVETSENAPSIIAVLPVHYKYKVVASIHVLSGTQSEVPDFARYPLQTIAALCGDTIARFLEGDIPALAAKLRSEMPPSPQNQGRPPAVKPAVPNAPAGAAAAKRPAPAKPAPPAGPPSAGPPPAQRKPSPTSPAQRPPAAAQRPPAAAQRPPGAAQRPPAPAQRPPAKPQQQQPQIPAHLLPKTPNATELLINSIPAFTFVMTMDGRIAYINKYTLDRLGYPKQEIIGSFITSLYPSGKQYTNLDRKYAILEHQEGDINYLLQAKGGTVYGVQFSMHRSRFNKKEAVICIGHEERTHHRGDDNPLSDKLETLTHELHQLKVEMEELRNYSENEEKKKEAFIEKVSYEIRSMLNAAIGMTGLLFDTNLDDEQIEYVETIRKSGDSMLEHINDIIDSINFDPSAGEAGDTFYNKFLSTEMAEEISGVDVAGKRLLLIDADRGNRATITRELERIGWKVSAVATVAEAKELLAKRHPIDAAIIDMNISRGDPHALAREIRSVYPPDALYLILTTGSAFDQAEADALGSAMFMQKPYDIDLLRYRLAKFLAGQQAKRMTKIPIPAGQERPFKILLVEDNHMDQKVAQWLLNNMGYMATIVENGLEALRAVESEIFDLIFMDIEMPEMDGLETTRKIRDRLPAERQPRIIAMTAHALKGDREQYLSAGMDDYISKPINEKKLIEVLSRNVEGIGDGDSAER